MKFKNNTGDISDNILNFVHENVTSVMAKKKDFEFLQKVVKDLGKYVILNSLLKNFLALFGGLSLWKFDLNLEMRQNQSVKDLNYTNGLLLRKADLIPFNDYKRKVDVYAGKIERIDADMDSFVVKNELLTVEKYIKDTDFELNKLKDKIEMEYYTQDDIDTQLKKIRKNNEENYVQKKEYKKKITGIFSQFTVVQK